MWINVGGLLLIALIVWWFWLYKPRDATVGDDLVVRVESGSYQPARIRLQAHRATALAFERIDPSPCAEMVLFPDLEISEQLAVGQITKVALPALAVGEYPFHCQMQMYRGVLIVE
jgi:plastocyanin domain-containing protein